MSTTVNSTSTSPRRLPRLGRLGWTLVATPIPAGAAASQLVSVSCAAPTSCVAVGDYQLASTGETKPLTETWNGTTWSIVTSPGPSPAS